MKTRVAMRTNAFVASLVRIVHAYATVLARRVLALVLVEALHALSVKPIRTTGGVEIGSVSR